MPASDGTLPDEKIARIVDALEAAELPYALGGAIALTYWSEPRGTVDIDINIFLPDSEAGTAFTVLERLGVSIAKDEAAREVLEKGQIRLDWGGTFVDLFFAYDPFHDSCRERSVVVDFKGRPARVLSAEDLVVFKVIFNRPHDWVDIEKLVATQGSRFDHGYARTWLTAILGDDDSRLPRLAHLVGRCGDMP